jgi:hypothetical protein
MDDRQLPSDDPEWLDEFQELADQQLGDGSSCEQVHPIIERWYDNLMQNDPPESRDAVMQAMACLSTEILYNTPDNVLEAVLEHVSEDELASWIEFVLMVGRAFEVSLRSGELDDL